MQKRPSHIPMKLRRFGVSAFAILASLALPLAGATACSFSRGPIVEDFMRADAAFVGEVSDFEIVTNNGFDRVRYGILSVKVKRPLYGKIEKNLKIKLYLDTQFIESEEYNSGSDDDEIILNKNIFFIDEKNLYEGDEYFYKDFYSKLPEREKDMYEVFYENTEGLGEPVFQWWVHGIGQMCGTVAIFGYNSQMEEKISGLRVNFSNDIVAKMPTEEISNQSSILNFPSDPSLHFIKPTYRQEYSFYLMISVFAFGVLASVLFLIRRRKRKPA